MNEEALNTLYSIAQKEGYSKSIEDFKILMKSNQDAVSNMHEAAKKEGYNKPIEDFNILVGFEEAETQEELTPEMMETGQRDASPAYAMTEEKYAAEKKKDGESPLQDGVSADVVEEPVVEEEPVGIFPVEEEEAVEEVSEEPVGIFPTEEVYKAKVPDFEDYGKKILSGEMTMKDVKTPDQIFDDKILKKSASEANRIVTNATIDLQKAIDQSPEIQGVVSKVQAKYQSQYQDKVADIQNLVNSGQMSEEDANNELQKFSSVMNKRISEESSKDPDFVKEVGRLKSIADEDINRKIADLQEEISIESEIRAQDKIQELGAWEGLGNAIQNEFTKTKMLPAQAALYAGQISEDIEGEDTKMPSLIIDENGVQFKMMTNKERQSENYKDIKKYQGQMQDVLPVIESYERGNYAKAASGAVSNAIQFMGSIARAIPTLGSSAVYEMGTPMYIDAVEAEAKRSGLTPEEVIANDTEDEITAMALGTMAGALETIGLGKSVGFIKNKILKDAVEETVKKNKKRIGKELWDITTRAAIETETEVTQGALEEANKELQERGIKIGTKGAGKTIWDNVRDAVTLSTDESRETAVATFLGSVLMFGGGRAGRIALRKGESVKVDGKQISQEDFQSFLDNATDEQIAAAKIDVKGNDTLKKAAEQKKKDVREGAIIKRDLAEAGITDAGRVSELVPLEKEKKKLQGNTTEAGKKKLQEINSQIEEVMAKEPTEEVVTEEVVDAPTYEAPTKVTSPTAEAFATVNRNDGKGTVTLTEDEYNAEMERFAPVEEAVVEDREVIDVTIDGAIDDFGDIDYEAEAEVAEIAKKRDLGITRDREIAAVASFDVVVDESVDGKGVGSKLLDRVKDLPFDVQEMNPDATIKVDVVNPQMQAMLEKRGFEVVEKIGEGRVIMAPKTETKTEQDAIQEPSTETVDVQEPARDGREMGEGDVREAAEEIDTEDQVAKTEEEIAKEEFDKFNAIIDGKKPRLRKGIEEVAVEDYVDVEKVAEQMNQLDPMFVNYTTPKLSEEIEVKPISEATDTSPIPQEILDEYGVKDATELEKPIESFEGIPMVKGGMTDMLAGGKTKDSMGNDMQVGGGIMFSLRNILNKGLAWAGVDRKGATDQYNDAVKLYNNNKQLFERLWKEGKLPNGHVPMAITRMDDTAVDSNEAVFRYLSPQIKSLPEANRKKAFDAAMKEISALDEGTNERVNKLVKKYSVTTLDGLFDAMVKDANVRTKDPSKSIFTLDQRTPISRKLISKTPTAKNNRAVTQALFEGMEKDSTLLTFKRIYDAIGEKSLRNTPKGYVVAVVGIDVLNGGVGEASHQNYGFGPKGRPIALITNPRHQVDIFPEMTARAAGQARVSVSKEGKSTMESAKNILGRATNTFFNTRPAQGQKVRMKVDTVDQLIGLMRLTFPSVQAYTSQAEFN
jgi:GNAT superfamily N-acetyltransferase